MIRGHIKLLTQGFKFEQILRRVISHKKLKSKKKINWRKFQIAINLKSTLKTLKGLLGLI
jgi:hypothetical protein